MFALLENQAVAICWLKQAELEPESKGGVTVPTRNPVQISYYRIKRAIQVVHKTTMSWLQMAWDSTETK